MNNTYTPAINKDNGELTLLDGIIIGPKVTRSEFVDKCNSAAIPFIGNGSWTSYKLSAHFPDSADWLIMLFFKDQQLWRLSLLKQLPADSESLWTEQTEHQRKLLHDQWLKSEKIRSGAYAWGSIRSTFDERSTCSTIIIDYAIRQQLFAD
jgi:hypothetical protein